MVFLGSDLKKLFLQFDYMDFSTFLRIEIKNQTQQTSKMKVSTTQLQKGNIGVIPILALGATCLIGCTGQSRLDYALSSAGSNRSELETVLEHYRTVDTNPQKLRAAEFLIENMPAHYSYAGTGIYEYYDYAARILADTTLTPEQQRDSLLDATDDRYADLPNHTVPDAQIIKADFLINV